MLRFGKKSGMSSGLTFHHLSFNHELMGPQLLMQLAIQSLSKQTKLLVECPAQLLMFVAKCRDCTAHSFITACLHP